MTRQEGQEEPISRRMATYGVEPEIVVAESQIRSGEQVRL
jgi:hypothetical protein